MLKSAILFAVLAAAGSGQATTVLFDDFEAEGPANTLNYSGFASWTVTGQVDLVGMPNPYGITCSGHCVDLDGTSGPGRIRTVDAFTFAPGDRVSISFDVSGSQRSADSDNFFLLLDFGTFVSVNIGDAVGTGGFSGLTVPLPSFFIAPVATFNRTIPGATAFSNWSYSFTALESGAVRFALGTTSADNFGPIVDNIRISTGAIPEPATWAMLIAGFGVVGVAARRRRAPAAA